MERIEKERQVPLYEEVAAKVSGMVDEGVFKPGDRIPSIRSLSRQIRVSINTVKEAYGWLEDRQVIEARPQSGYYVCARLPQIPQEPEIHEPDISPCEVSAGELVTMIMRDCANSNLVPFGAAVPDLDLLPVKRLNQMLSSETRRHPADSVNYALPQVCERLRVQVARHMLQARCTLSPDDIWITTGGMEAVVLALRAVCRPGDTLAIESPTYFNFLQLIQELGLKILEIPSSPRDGISLDALRYALENTKVHACLVISNFNNPLGGQMPEENKKELAALLARGNIPLIEDDVHGDLSFSDERPSVVKGYDKNGNVLLCSSFSKTLAPGYRVGWIAPGKYHARVEQQKLITTIASSSPVQLAIAEFLANGGYQRHLRTIRRTYAKRVAMMGAAIGRFFPEGTCVTRPAGGFTLWVELPERVDSRRLYAEAKKMGVSIAPGTIFAATDRFRNCIRLNAAIYSERVEWAVEALGQIACRLNRA